VTAFIDHERGRFGVEPICRTLDVSASAYHHRKTGARPVRAVEDERISALIREVHRENYECYGYRRVHAALSRASESGGRDRVARLMRQSGLEGAKRRGKKWKTTIPDPNAQKRPDLVKRDFTATAPDRLWCGDFTYPADLGRPRVLQLHPRRVLTPDRRVAARHEHAHHARFGRAANGALDPPARR
jgi:putative transposase